MFDSIYGWLAMICCINVPFKTGLTVNMVGLPRFVVYMYPFKAGLTVYVIGLPRFVVWMYPLRQV